MTTKLPFAEAILRADAWRYHKSLYTPQNVGTQQSILQRSYTREELAAADPRWPDVFRARLGYGGSRAYHHCGAILRAIQFHWATPGPVLEVNAERTTHVMRLRRHLDTNADGTAHAMEIDLYHVWQGAAEVGVSWCAEKMRYTLSTAWLDQYYPGVAARLAVAIALDLPEDARLAYALQDTAVQEAALPADLTPD